MKILLILSSFILSSCFQSSKFDTCDRENEKLIQIDGGEKCLARCSKKSDCQNTDECVTSVCAPAGSIFSVVEPVEQDVGSDIVKTDIVVTEDVTIISEQEAEEACGAFYQRAKECTQSQCTTDIDLDEIAAVAATVATSNEGLPCKAHYLENTRFRNLLNQANVAICSWSFWRGLYCSVSLTTDCQSCQPATKVGAACASGGGCAGGDFGGFCVEPQTETESFDSYVDGYCVAGCSDSEPENLENYQYQNSEQCGEGNACLVFVDETSRNGLCVQGCARHDDCRAGYECIRYGVDEAGKVLRFLNPSHLSATRCFVRETTRAVKKSDLSVNLFRFVNSSAVRLESWSYARTRVGLALKQAV